MTFTVFKIIVENGRPDPLRPQTWSSLDSPWHTRRGSIWTNRGGEGVYLIPVPGVEYLRQLRFQISPLAEYLVKLSYTITSAGVFTETLNQAFTFDGVFKLCFKIHIQSVLHQSLFQKLTHNDIFPNTLAH